MNEEIKWVVFPQPTYSIRYDTMYKVGCYKTIGSLVNFSGFRIGNGIIRECSYANREAFPDNAIVVSENFVKAIREGAKKIFVEVEWFIKHLPEDKSSRCFVGIKDNSIYLINGNPDSEWKHYLLQKKEIPQISHYSDTYVFAINESDKKFIDENIFFVLMNMIQDGISQLRNFIEVYLSK